MCNIVAKVQQILSRRDSRTLQASVVAILLVISPYTLFHDIKKRIATS